MRSLALIATTVLLTACGGGGGSGPLPGPGPTPTPVPAGRIAHVIIIFQENRTPDNLFHGLPGADIASTGMTPNGPVPLQPVDITAPYDLDHSHGGFVTDYASGANNGFHPVGTPTAYGYVPPS